MKHYSLYIIYAAFALALASCHSSKKVADTAVTPPVGNATVQKPAAPADPNFTAKVKVRLAMGEQDISTSGTLRMRWNDVIQLTLVDPILGIAEVGRMEMSADSLLVIDRMNKRYVSAAYSQVPGMAEHGIDFAAIQSLFWNEAREKDEFSFDIPLSKPATLHLHLSNKGNADNWEGHTTVSSKYAKVSVERLFKSLMQAGE